MTDIEKLGAFYLGRRVEGNEPFVVDAKDFTTHALIVGMTGSGKTGLGAVILEEAAIDGIPALVIDPKGDMGNLLLAFPSLSADDFRPWVDAGEDPAQVAERWRAGLAEWGQDGARIERFRRGAPATIYTPGSDAGVPLAVLGSLAAPAPSVAASPELLRDRVVATASGLLHLAGVDSDSLRGREHILLATILERLWSEGKPADLAGLVHLIQKPPFDRVGVLDLESFFPSAARFELAAQLNSLLASPGFSAWTRGAPLDPQKLLFGDDGKPRLAIISIAHMSDDERLSFVTLLLAEVIAWMRAQPGTSSLRALLYMDEIAGYFPPVANPPSKAPMLTLLKQARAYGLGVVLATQNPVDLDYKGLANCGTWFIGRLQAERDKLRLLDGLEAASAVSGQGFARGDVERTLSGLEKRVFYVHSVHAGDALVRTRWSLSYLRGPLTREQIERLTPEREEAPAPAAPAPRVETAAERPVVPPEVPELFVAGATAYQPAIFGSARVRYVNAKLGVDHWETVVLLAPVADDIDWTAAQDVSKKPPELEKQPTEGARFASLPAAAARKASYPRWERQLALHLLEHRRLDLWRAPSLGEVSRPGESDAELRARLSGSAREARDAEVAKLRRKYSTQLATAREKVRRAEEQLDLERGQVRDAGTQAAINAGTAILGAFFGGRRRVSSTRVGAAARGASRMMKERGDVAAAEADLEAARARAAEVEASLQGEVEALGRKLDAGALAIEAVPVVPKKSDISIGTVALVWLPA